MFKIFWLCIIMVLALPATTAADWAHNLVTDPALESPVPPVPSSIDNGREYFFFINDSTADATQASSSWIFLPAYLNVDICLDNDVALEATGTSTLEVAVLFRPFGAGGVPANTNLALKLLGVTLDGVPSTSGTTNDCIYDIKGPGWLQIDITTSDADQDGLVSVVQRSY